jgi:hypothetical protein
MSRSDEFANGHNHLSDQDAAYLDFAGKRYRNVGNKEQDIRQQFGMNATAYYQNVNRILDDPAAMSHNDGQYAPLVHRLRSMRDVHRDKRSARRIPPS